MFSARTIRIQLQSFFDNSSSNVNFEHQFYKHQNNYDTQLWALSEMCINVIRIYVSRKMMANSK